MTRLLGFDEFMEGALYDPATGFFGSVDDDYRAAGGYGRVPGSRSRSANGNGQAGGAHGDFITSPETGPLFGLLIARYLYRCWERIGCPDHFDVVEYAAGRGALAITVRAAVREDDTWSKFAAALRYHMVERSERLRTMQTEHLDITPVGTIDPTTVGPLFHSHADGSTLPSDADVVLANELLDNVPFALFERVGIDAPDIPDWLQVMVGEPGGSSNTWFEHLQPGDNEDALLLRRLAPDAPLGARAPLQVRAADWLRGALDLVGSVGTVVVIDYCRNTADMAMVDQSEWLRTYCGHDRAGSPLECPGSRDITVDVAVDQLSLVRRPTENHSQADWLSDLGIDELVEEGREIWRASAAAPGLAAIRARSRVSEAEALCDPDGLGAFRVLIWQG